MANKKNILARRARRQKQLGGKIAKIERKIESKIAPMLVNRMRPVKLRQPKVTQRGNSASIAGTIYWQDIGDCKQERGTILAQLDFNPTFFPDEEVQSKIRFYEFWDGECIVHADISAPNTNRGNITAFWDPDPVDELPSDGQERIQTAYRHTKGKSWPLVNGTKTISWRFNGTRKPPSGFYTDTPPFADCDRAEKRQNFKGRFFLLVNTPSDSTINPGELSITYHFRFWQRKLDFNEAQPLSIHFNAVPSGDMPWNMDSYDKYGELPAGEWTNAVSTTSKGDAPMTNYDTSYVFDGALDTSTETNIQINIAVLSEGISGVTTALSLHYLTGTHGDFAQQVIDSGGEYAGCVAVYQPSEPGTIAGFGYRLTAPGTDVDIKNSSVLSFAVTGLPNTVNNRRMLGKMKKSQKQVMHDELKLMFRQARDARNLAARDLLTEPIDYKRLAAELKRQSHLSLGDGMGLGGAISEDYDIVNAGAGGSEASKTVGPGVPIGQHDIPQDEKRFAREADSARQREQEQQKHALHQAQRVASVNTNVDTPNATDRRSVFSLFSGAGRANEPSAAGASARSASLK